MAQSLAQAAAHSPVRVMVVDDSAVARGFLSRWIEAEPGLELAGSAADGAQAVSRLAEMAPDVVVLDLEMPVMGGLEALPRLLAARPGLRVLIASGVTQRGAAAAFRALDAGAADCIGKPESGLAGGDGYRQELLAKVRALAVTKAGAAAPVTLRPKPRALRRPEALVIGASTGGPQALRAFLTQLGGWSAPILVVQHMPAAFTKVLAEHLSSCSPFPAVEAEHGMALEPGRIHLAPGDRHMSVVRGSGGAVLALDDGPPVNFCRPAVDPMFRSAAAAFGAQVVGVVLTGMGADGREGARALVGAGGVVLVQDESSSVVWGMPGAVATAGLASLVAPVGALAEATRRLGRGEGL